MNPKLFDGIETLIETQGELTKHPYPIGTAGTIVECLRDAYIIEFPVPGSDREHGYFEDFDLVTLTLDQFNVVAPHNPESNIEPLSKTRS